MPRARTGTIQPFTGADGKTYYRARIRLGDGSRPWRRAPDGFSEARAREWAAAIQEREDAEGKILAAKTATPARGESFRDWADRWIASRVTKGHTSTRDDRSRLTSHVFPHIGPTPIVDVTRMHIEQIVEGLDVKVRAGEISWKTASNTWAILSKAFSDAENAKQRDLRVRSDNPCDKVAPPDRGARKSKQFLFPSELLKVMQCERVPLGWRRLIALAVYLFPRAAELEALEWSDVDLERGVIHIHRAIDRERGGEKATKTGRARRFSIEPNVLPLLKAMHRDSGGVGRVVAMPRMRDLAEGLRNYLRLAGVERSDVFANDKTRKWITWHDLRATGCTWLAIKGVEPLHIQYRAGHTSFSTTQLYIRQAEAVRDGFGDVFPALTMLLEAPRGGTVWSTIGPRQTGKRYFPREIFAERAGFETGAGERVGGDSRAIGSDAGAADARPSSDNPAMARAVDQSLDRSSAPVDAVEEALARAVTEASAAGRFDVVAQLAKELEARRLARSANVVPIRRDRKQGVL